MVDNNKSFDLYKQAIEEFELKDVQELLKTLKTLKSGPVNMTEDLVKKLDKDDTNISETERILLEQSKEALDTIKFLEEVIKGLEKKEKEKLEKELKDMGDEINRNKLKSDKLKKEISEIKEKIKQQENIIIKNTEKNNQLKEKTEETKSKIKKLRQELEKTKEDKNLKPDDKKNKIKNILAEIENLKGESKKIITEITKLAVNTDEAKRKIENFNKELLPKENELKGLESKLGDTGQKVEEIAKKAFKLGDRELAELVKFMKGAHNITREETKKTKEDVKETKKVTNTAKIVANEQLNIANATVIKSEKNKEELQDLKESLEDFSYNYLTFSLDYASKYSNDYYVKNPELIKYITDENKLEKVLNSLKNKKENLKNIKIKNVRDFLNPKFYNNPDILILANNILGRKINSSDAKDIIYKNFEFKKKKNKNNLEKSLGIDKEIENLKYILDNNLSINLNTLKKITELKEKLKIIKDNDSKNKLESFLENVSKKMGILDDLKKYEKYLSNYERNSDDSAYNKSNNIVKNEMLLKLYDFEKKTDFKKLYNYLKNSTEDYIRNFLITGYSNEQIKIITDNFENFSGFNNDKKFKEILKEALKYKLEKNPISDLITKNFLKDKEQQLKEKEVQIENNKDIKNKKAAKNKIRNELLIDYLLEDQKIVEKCLEKKEYKKLDNIIALTIKENIKTRDERFKFVNKVLKKLLEKNESWENFPRFAYWVKNFLFKKQVIENKKIKIIKDGISENDFKNLKNGENEPTSNIQINTIKKIIEKYPEFYINTMNSKQQANFVLTYIDSLVKNNKLEPYYLSYIKIDSKQKLVDIYRKLKEKVKDEENLNKLMQALLNNNKIQLEVINLHKKNLDKKNSKNLDKKNNKSIKEDKLSDEDKKDYNIIVRMFGSKIKKNIGNIKKVIEKNKELKEIYNKQNIGKIRNILEKNLDFISEEKDREIKKEQMLKILEKNKKGEDFEKDLTDIAEIFEHVPNGKQKLEKILRDLLTLNVKNGSKIINNDLSKEAKKQAENDGVIEKEDKTGEYKISEAERKKFFLAISNARKSKNKKYFKKVSEGKFKFDEKKFIEDYVRSNYNGYKKEDIEAFIKLYNNINGGKKITSYLLAVKKGGKNVISNIIHNSSEFFDEASKIEQKIESGEIEILDIDDNGNVTYKEDNKVYSTADDSYIDPKTGEIKTKNYEYNEEKSSIKVKDTNGNIIANIQIKDEKIKEKLKDPDNRERYVSFYRNLDSIGLKNLFPYIDSMASIIGTISGVNNEDFFGELEQQKLVNIILESTGRKSIGTFRTMNEYINTYLNQYSILGRFKNDVLKKGDSSIEEDFMKKFVLYNSNFSNAFSEYYNFGYKKDIYKTS